MKVVIDISPLRTGHKTRGIGIYTRRLIEALHAGDKKNKYIITTKLEHVKDADIVHYPYFDLFFPTLPLRKKTETVVTIHDVIPLIFPKEFPAGIRGRLSLLTQKISLKKIGAVITDSQNSKKDIVKYLKIEPSRIHVVYLAAGQAFYPREKRKVDRARKKYKLPRRFVLYVGDVNPNKNLSRLVEAMKKVIKEAPDTRLVLVGRAFANKKLPELKAIRMTIQKEEMREKVRLLTKVPLDPPDDLAAIYTAAQVYVQPSTYEGFGLPILEAFSCNTPVVAANVASIPEITDDAAIMIDPYSIESLSKGITKALSLGKKEREKRVQRGRAVVKRFSWSKTAEETIKVYKQLMRSENQ